VAEERRGNGDDFKRPSRRRLPVRRAVTGVWVSSSTFASFVTTVGISSPSSGGCSAYREASGGGEEGECGSQTSLSSSMAPLCWCDETPLTCRVPRAACR
jgi:hypothetical protein